MRRYFFDDGFAVVQYVSFSNRDDGLIKVAVYGIEAADNQRIAALRMGWVIRPVTSMMIPVLRSASLSAYRFIIQKILRV